MAILKAKEIKNLGKKEIEEKLKELKIELLKSRGTGKAKVKTKEIKKAIARLLMFKNK